MKILAVIGILIILILGIFFIFFKPQNKLVLKTEPSPTKAAVNITASFAIFTNGTYRIFTDPKYHNRSSDVFMNEANIVFVKKENITWSDFFKTLPMTLNKECIITGTGQTFCTDTVSKLRFFINNIEDPNALVKSIKQGDKLLVSYGDETDEQISLQQEQIPNP